MNRARETILVVDDEPQILRFMATGLGAHDYGVATSASGADGLRLAATARPDLVVLDLGLPDMDGFTVLQRLREWSKVPVIILSVRAHEGEKVRALDVGADDYVVKPFGMAELLARIRAALRRRVREEAPEPVFQTGGLEVDLIRRTVAVDGAPVKLSAKQYKLLQILVGHAGKVVTHHQLLTEIWGPAHANDVHYLRIFVRKLRMKIEPEPSQPRYLATELGVGYRLRTQDQIDGGF